MTWRQEVQHTSKAELWRVKLDRHGFSLKITKLVFYYRVSGLCFSNFLVALIGYSIRIENSVDDLLDSGSG